MFTVRFSSFARRALGSCRKVFAFSIAIVLASNSLADARCGFQNSVPTPILGPAAATLSGTAIVSPNDVWAVGAVSSEFGTSTATLAEHWNGSRWEIAPTPSPFLGGYVGDALNGAAAISSSDVWAVGQAGTYYGGQSALIEHWNGTAWTVASSPQVDFSSLSSVSATSSSNVWAAGSQRTQQGYSALVEMWNGSSWSIVPLSDGPVTSISATSPTDVWATANDVEHWNGTSWSVVSTLPASAVSAVAPNDVWVVEGGTEVAHWDGSTWQVVSSPQIGNLRAVSANTSSNAWAVGQLYSNQPLVEHWDGSTWTQLSAPNDSHSGGLLGIALAGSSAVAVGNHASPPHRESQGLQMAWDGSRWRLELGPPVDSVSNTFEATYSPGTSFGEMWAVGGYAIAGSLQFPEPSDNALIERDLSGSWVQYRSPPSLAWLFSVTGRSATDVWAAGVGSDSCSSSQAVAARWDGVRWTAEIPNVCAGAGSEFDSIAMDDQEVWAVGSDTEPGAHGSQITHELVAGRHLSVWTIYPMPDDPYNGGLTSVFDGSRDDVWAAGVNAPTRGVSTNIIYHWNGVSWSDQMVQDPEAFGYIFAIADKGPTDAWAVGGQKRSRYGRIEPLILHYDGVNWTVAKHGAARLSGALSSISIVEKNDVWASSANFVAHWNGHDWSFIDAPPGVFFSGIGRFAHETFLMGVGDTLTPDLNGQAVAWTINC